MTGALTLAFRPSGPVLPLRSLTALRQWCLRVAPVVGLTAGSALRLSLPLTRRTAGPLHFLARRALGGLLLNRGRRARLATTGCQAPNLAHLGFIQVNKKPTPQAARQHHAAITDADQPAHAQAHLVEQFSHLTVAPLGDHHAVPAVHAFATTVFDRLEAGALTVNLDAFEQALTWLGFERAQHPHSVFALDAKARMHQLIGQLARVGEEQQAFGVDVEPAH